jgi:predicted nucleic acid-binding protein
VAYLMDTNLLLRSINRNDPQHDIAVNAMETLRRQGEQMCIVPQNIYEFWYVCTRSTARNGLGLTIEETVREIANIEALFTLLSDVPSIYGEWRHLVETYSIAGAPAHDARLVAAMRIHSIDRLLTFNGTDFRRYPGLIVVAPQDL